MHGAGAGDRRRGAEVPCSTGQIAADASSLKHDKPSHNSSFHKASAANLFIGKGNCAILDGHVEAFTRAETSPHTYPH